MQYPASAVDHLLLLAGRVVATDPAEVLTDLNLAEAYGGHLLRLDDQTLIIDEHPHH